jgi:hypothetical protein
VRKCFICNKEEEKETSELVVDYRQLSPEALAKVRRAAMEMDERAYERSSEAYRETPPVEHTPRVE